MFSKEVESESQWDLESPTSRVWKCSMSARQDTIALPSKAVQSQYIPQPTNKVDHPGSLRHNVVQNFAGPATPKRQVIRPYDPHTRSLARLANEDVEMRIQCKRQPLSMWSIVASVVLLQRYMKGVSSRQGKSPSYEEKAAVSQPTLQATPSILMISKNVDVK
jgi:hypothetical protein